MSIADQKAREKAEAMMADLEKRFSAKAKKAKQKAKQKAKPKAEPKAEDQPELEPMIVPSEE